MLVVHHNVVPGELSKRWGLTRHEAMLDAIVATGADIVLAGHDHQETVPNGGARRSGRFVASTAGTLSNRSRGARASAFMTVEADDRHITVTPHHFVEAGRRLPRPASRTSPPARPLAGLRPRRP